MVSLNIHMYLKIIALSLSIVTVMSAVISVWPITDSETIIENAFPISEENAENSTKENLTPETEDKIFEPSAAFSANSRTLSLFRLVEILRPAQVYRTVPSPPPDLI